MSHLEKLTLGQGACDHTIYPKLPASLKQLCISLPNGHQNARLVTVADELTSRLTRIQRLELYSHFYFPPPVDIAYDTSPSGTAAQQSQLREVRLSHLRAAPGEIARSLSRVGSNLSTLALHHVSETHESLWPLCHQVRRLELGEARGTDPSVPAPSIPTTASLTFLRIKTAITDTTVNLISQGVRLLPRLSTLDLIALAPSRPDDPVWQPGGSFDDLLGMCKERHICLCVNARPIATLEKVREAVVSGHSGREGLDVAD